MTALACAVLTISDTRTEADDTSGDLLVELLTGAGHRLVERAIDRDDIYAIRATVSRWNRRPRNPSDPHHRGTGFTGRDSTPEALSALFDKTINGFGELFRQVSYDEIGSSTIQSRAIGGSPTPPSSSPCPAPATPCAPGGRRSSASSSTSTTAPATSPNSTPASGSDEGTNPSAQTIGCAELTRLRVRQPPHLGSRVIS